MSYTNTKNKEKVQGLKFKRKYKGLNLPTFMILLDALWHNFGCSTLENHIYFEHANMLFCDAWIFFLMPFQAVKSLDSNHL
jgi:hypothetical protein